MIQERREEIDDVVRRLNGKQPIFGLFRAFDSLQHIVTDDESLTANPDGTDTGDTKSGNSVFFEPDLKSNLFELGKIRAFFWLFCHEVPIFTHYHGLSKKRI